MKHTWYLILNNSHKLRYFSSEKKLRLYAKEYDYAIKRSYTDEHGFYTDSIEFVPMRKDA